MPRKTSEDDMDRDDIAKRLRDHKIRESQFKTSGRGLNLKYGTGPVRPGSKAAERVYSEPQEHPESDGGSKLVKMRDLVSRVLMDLEDHDAAGAAKYRKELRGI